MIEIKDNEEITWICAFLIMASISAVVATLRFFSIIIFSFEFELCILYLPTIILLIFACFYIKKSKKIKMK